MNGTGKTNLLDAIYYLSFTRSYFSRPDTLNIHHGMAGMRLEGNYQLQSEPQLLTCIVRENNKKEISLNQEEYKKFSDHIGRIPCVMIAPDDISLITGGGEERRKFIDTILSQIDKTYLQHLIDYTKQKDLVLQRTTVGIHREDLSFYMGEAAFKTEASQGQRKSLLFALKLAEWQVLKDKKGFTPILLLDDVFEKLDEQRMFQLLHWVCTESDGQVFITDTHSQRLQTQLENTKTAFQLINLANPEDILI